MAGENVIVQMNVKMRAMDGVRAAIVRVQPRLATGRSRIWRSGECTYVQGNGRAPARGSKRQPEVARACRKGNTVTYRMAENERQDPTKKVECRGGRARSAISDQRRVAHERERCAEWGMNDPQDDCRVFRRA